MCTNQLTSGQFFIAQEINVSLDYNFQIQQKLVNKDVLNTTTIPHLEVSIFPLHLFFTNITEELIKSISKIIQQHFGYIKICFDNSLDFRLYSPIMLF